MINGLLSTRPLAEKLREEWPFLKTIDRDMRTTAPDSRQKALAAAVAARKLTLRKAADQARASKFHPADDPD